MIILGIETSCDETAAAVLRAEGGLNPSAGRPHFEILSNIISSQVKIHRPFGGVVPNLAKREHQKNLVPVLKRALREAKLLKNHELGIRNYGENLNSKFLILNSILEREPELLKITRNFLLKYGVPKIDAIAVTRGPGLAPALWPGVNLARALAYAWKKPIAGVNHVEGHIAANWLEPISGNSKFQIPNSKFLFPAVCLVVSGGHTQLILMKNFGRYKLIGETRDDAAGECFDKAARVLGLGYPGGPAIAAVAAKSGINNGKLRIKLPRPMINTKDYDFSFSGLKTAVLYTVAELTKRRKLKDFRDELAAECQQAVIDVLISKTLRAAKNYQAKTVMLAGGVTANQELRRQMNQAVKKQMPNARYRIPDTRFCTDNAAMIAAAVYFHPLKKDFTDWRKLKAEANLRLA